MPSSFVISSLPLRVLTDRGKEKRLLPFGRLASAIKPGVSRLTWTAKGSDNLSSGKISKRFSEGHGQILPLKKKSAMQKINLDKCPQCRQSLRMSNTNQLTAREIELKLQFVRMTRQEIETMMNTTDNTTTRLICWEYLQTF